MTTTDRITDLLIRRDKLPKIVHSRAYLDWIAEAADCLEAARRQHDGDQASLRTATATVEGLQAMLAKVPTTADGVPIHHGQQLFRLGVGDIKPAVVRIRVTSLDGYSEIYALQNCYSTREAAEQADKQRQEQLPHSLFDSSTPSTPSTPEAST